MMNRLLRRLREDAGFTMIELIVVCALLGAVMAAVGGMYISTLKAERQVSGDTTAANDAQLAARAIDDAMRNGSSFYVTDGFDGGQLLVVRTAGAGSSVDWSCAAWYYSPENGGEIRTEVQPDGSNIGLPGNTELPGWTLLVSGLTSSGAVFTAVDDVLQVAFETVDSEGRTTTTIAFASSLSPAEAEETDSCS
jgi:prepilin-type N-terminal cleavage/methylation domain-containing protein